MSPYSQPSSLNGGSGKASFILNYSDTCQDLQDLRRQQTSLLMLNSILARKLAGDFDGFDSTFNTADLLDRPSFSMKPSTSHGQTATAKAPSKESKPKIDETPEVLARHGIHGKVSGFKGEFQCDKCPFRAEKVREKKSLSFELINFKLIHSFLFFARHFTWTSIRRDT